MPIAKSAGTLARLQSAGLLAALELGSFYALLLFREDGVRRTVLSVDRLSSYAFGGRFPGERVTTFPAAYSGDFRFTGC